MKNSEDPFTNELQMS